MKYDDESSEGFWHIENSALLVVKYWLSRILHEPMAEYKEIERGIKIKLLTNSPNLYIWEGNVNYSLI